MTAGHWTTEAERSDEEPLTARSILHEWNTAILGLPTFEQREAAYCDAILSLSVLLASGEQSVERAQSILAAAVAAVTS